LPFVALLYADEGIIEKDIAYTVVKAIMEAIETNSA
jgi:hypothetical protein